MKKYLISIVSFMYLLSSVFSPIGLKVYADTIKSVWGASGVGTFQTTITDNYQSGQLIVDDEGAVITTYDGLTTTNTFAQRVDRTGTRAWGTSGIELSNNATGTQRVTGLVSDGQGGAIFVWNDPRSGTSNIYMQRISKAGSVLWTSGGVQVTNVNSADASITSDMQNGAIISWTDSRSGTNVYAQRIDSTGAPVWAANGVLIGTATSSKATVSDGNGGAYIGYNSATGLAKLQRIDSSGTLLWIAGGISVISLSNSNLSSLNLDSNLNPIVSIVRVFSGLDTDLYIQKLDSSGNLQWGTNGTTITALNPAGVNTTTSLILDSLNNSYVGWKDTRNTNDNAFIQKVNSSGTTQWTTDGVKVINGTWTQSIPYLAIEGTDLLAGVQDSRRAATLGLYVQKFNSAGTILFPIDGYAVYSSSITTLVFGMVSNTKGGVYVLARESFPKVFKIETSQSNRATLFSDRMSRINETTVSSHTITFLSDSGIYKNDIISVTLPVAFTFGGSYDFNDIQLQQGSSGACDSATYTAKTIGSAASGSTWGATYSSNKVSIIADTDMIIPGRCIRVILNTNGAGHTITNPTVTSDTVYHVTTSTASQSGDAAIIILNDLGTPDSDQIQISGTIDTTISLDLDTVVTGCANNTETSLNAVDLGVLTPGTVSKSNATIKYICIDASTNAGLGLNIFARSSRSNAAGGLVSGGNVITSATADLTLTGTTSGYGIRVSSVGTPSAGTLTINSPFNSGTSGSVGALPGILTTAAQIVDSTGPVSTGASSRIAVEVAAKASNLTLPGTYSDIISFTALVNF